MHRVNFIQTGHQIVCTYRPCRSVLSGIYLSLQGSSGIFAVDDDKDIPVSHASAIFDAFLEPYLPSSPHLPENPFSHREWDNYTAQDTLRAVTRKDVVRTVNIEGYGVYEEMQPSVVAKESRKVALLRTERGGHDIGRVEGVHDTIGHMFNFY